MPAAAQAKPADPCAMVIFGATGDLTKRLVVPALYNLSRTKVLPEQFALIGVARRDGTAESWRDQLYDMLKSFVGNAGAEFNVDHIDEAGWQRLAEKMAYVQGDLTKPDLYEKLRGVLDQLKKPMAPAATPSSISRSPIASSAPSWSNSARPSSPIRTRTRMASHDFGAGW